MKNQAIEQTQLNEIKQQISEFATSKTVKERIKNLEPLTELADVLLYQKETGEAVSLLENKKSVPFMASEEIDRLLLKVEDGYILEPKELLEVAEFFGTIGKLKSFFYENQHLAPTLAQYATDLQVFSNIEKRINLSIKHNQVTSEASRDLRKARQSMNRYESEIRNRLTKFIAHPSNQSKIQEFMMIERDGRMTVPIKSSFKHQVKGRIVAESTKGATAYIELDTTRELQQKRQLAKAEEISIIYQILATLTEEIATEILSIKETIEHVFLLEMIIAKGKYSYQIGGEKVSINNQGYIHLINARHPLFGINAVPLTINLGKKERGLVITGSNSGGKTVVLKTIGLLTLMTMIGVLIPANRESDISIFDHILVDIGDYQDMVNALSTFSGHIDNMGKVLNIATSKSLVLVDEIGSGTEPIEGAALAVAILEDLVERGALVLASTHYGEIKEFALNHDLFVTAAMAFNAETLQPQYRLLMNEVGASNGFFIAKKMKLSENILNRADTHLNGFKSKL